MASGDLPSPYLAGSRSRLIYWKANVLRSTWRWAMDSHRLASSHRNFWIANSTWFIIILPIKRGRNLGLNVQTNIIHHWHHCWSRPLKSQSYLIKSHETQEFLLIFRQMSQVIPQHIPFVRMSEWAGRQLPATFLFDFPSVSEAAAELEKMKGTVRQHRSALLGGSSKMGQIISTKKISSFFFGKICFFFCSWLSLPAISPMGCPKFDHSNASNVLILLGETFGGSKLMCEKQTL